MLQEILGCGQRGIRAASIRRSAPYGIPSRAGGRVADARGEHAEEGDFTMRIKLLSAAAAIALALAGSTFAASDPMVGGAAMVYQALTLWPLGEVARRRSNAFCPRRRERESAGGPG